MQKGMIKLKNVEIKEFHQARWNEPIVMELSVPGERGVLLPGLEKELEDEAGYCGLQRHCT